MSINASEQPTSPQGSEPYQHPPVTTYSYATEPAATRPTAPAPEKKRTGLIVGLAVLLVALVAGGYFALSGRSTTTGGTTPAASTTKAPTPLEAAVDKCYVHADPEDLGHTLTLSNVGANKNPGDDDLSTAQCVFTALKVPSSVLDHIGQTRALDGMQTDSWGDMNARWTYHPDSGMNITFTDAKK